MSGGLRLLPNIGAEEGDAALDFGLDSVAAAVAGLWLQLFASGTRWFDDGRGGSAGRKPGEVERAAIFPWLDAQGVTAWLNTEAAQARAAAAGAPLTGPPPPVVARVHDKAFAQEVARSEGLLPEPLAETLTILEPDLLRDPDAAAAAVTQRLRQWPETARRSFTLKPRFGSSGRGRVAGRDGHVDTTIRNAFPRLAARGGALLEPWLERTEDLSAALWIAPSGELTLLGTSAQVLAASGLYRGQRGTVDTKGRVTSGSDCDEELRMAAAVVSGHAAAAGFFGPCGLDAFRFRVDDGRERFRPIVEWNARFTLGMIAIGLVKRERGAIRAAFAQGPERQLAFEFRLDAPDAGWPDSDAELLVFRYHDPGARVRPGLAVSLDRASLAARLGDAG